MFELNENGNVVDIRLADNLAFIRKDDTIYSCNDTNILNGLVLNNDSFSMSYDKVYRTKYPTLFRVYIQWRSKDSSNLASNQTDTIPLLEIEEDVKSYLRNIDTVDQDEYHMDSLETWQNNITNRVNFILREIEDKVGLYITDKRSIFGIKPLYKE